MVVSYRLDTIPHTKKNLKTSTLYWNVSLPHDFGFIAPKTLNYLAFEFECT